MSLQTPESLKHSFLHQLSIATPCSAYWHEMEGDDRARFCGQCELNVYNLSEMTAVEAQELIIEKEGKVCLRMYRRHDGTILTKDCPVGIAARIKSYARRSCAAFVAICSVIAGYVMLKKDVESSAGFSRQVITKYKYVDDQMRAEQPTPGTKAQGDSVLPLSAGNSPSPISTNSTEGKNTNRTKSPICTAGASNARSDYSPYMMGAPPPITTETYAGNHRTDADANENSTESKSETTGGDSKPKYVTEYR